MPSRRKSSTFDPGGFTIIELLVVIGIILVLTGILLPVFVRAKTQAGYATCLSNMRQIGVGLLLYEQDNNGYEPPWAFFLVPPWPQDPVWFKQSLGSYLSEGVWWCPEESWNHLTRVPSIGPPEFGEVPTLSSYIMFPAVFSRDHVFDRTGIVRFSSDSMEKQSTDIWFDQIVHRTLDRYGPPYSTVFRRTVHGNKEPLLFLDGHTETLPCPNFYSDSDDYKYQ